MDEEPDYFSKANFLGSGGFKIFDTLWDEFVFQYSCSTDLNENSSTVDCVNDVVRDVRKNKISLDV